DPSSSPTTPGTTPGDSPPASSPSRGGSGRGDARFGAAEGDGPYVDGEEYGYDEEDEDYSASDEGVVPAAPAAASAGLLSRFGAVVLLEVSFVEPDYLRPWQKSPQGSCTGTGFAVPDDDSSAGGKRRLLTNLHVVQDATDIRVRKHGHSRRWRARVVARAADVDLAVVRISSDDPEEVEDFWRGIAPVTWVEGAAGGAKGGDEKGGTGEGGEDEAKDAADSLPPLQSPVSAVGFPTGGRTICVTEGVVSRIDCRNYRIKTSGAAPGKLLVIQVDSAINPGNSGGPCFDGSGRVVGVAFQGLDGNDAQNVGYIIPACVALNFLAVAAEDDGDGGYGGVQELPFRWANLQNRSLRKFLRFDGNSGVVVTKVSPLASQAHGGDDFLERNDVITHIDGRELGEDYTVPLRGDELMNADFLITGKRRGERTCFRVVRDTVSLEIEAVLAPLVPNCPRDHGIDCTPEWLVVGGLLFVPLTCPLLSYGAAQELESSGYLAIYDYMDEELKKFRQDNGHSEIIILIDILKADVNFGYDFHQRWRKLDSLNGRKLRNMAELYNMYVDACRSVEAEGEEESKPTEFLEFIFRGESRIVLETRECLSSEAEVLEQHGIPKAVSAGIFERAERERKGDENVK
ncbi:hypothetical protein ACHAWF_008067, partial [Thalassiosira exigua]